MGYEDSVEDVYGYLMDSNGPQADPDKVRLTPKGSSASRLVNGARRAFQNVRVSAACMMALTDDCLLYTGSEKAGPMSKIGHAPRGHNLYVEGDNGGPLFVKIITEAVEKRDIDVHIEARA